MESFALLLYKNLNITWLSVCKEQMYSLLFHKAYQGHATKRSNKECPVTVPQTQHLFSAAMVILSNVFLNFIVTFDTVRFHLLTVPY